MCKNIGTSEEQLYNKMTFCGHVQETKRKQSKISRVCVVNEKELQNQQHMEKKFPFELREMHNSTKQQEIKKCDI